MTLDLRERVSLAPYTTFGLGGPARWFIAAQSDDQITAALRWAKERGTPVFILGGGSNLVVSDDGFDGLVIRIETRGIDLADDGENVRVRAAAGEEWDPFVAFCVARDLAGVECLSGIPGSVGATPIQNVGAYGQEVAETVASVEVLDRRTFETRTLTSKECEFGYRYSFFKNIDPERYVVTAVDYLFKPNGAPALRYAELERQVRERVTGREPTLKEVRDIVLDIRRGKGMVVDPNDPDSRSAGSFFMNPVLAPEEFERFVARVEESGVLRDGDRIPQFPTPDGKFKSSAAWLIERAGFRKGHGEGKVGVSTKHTLALVNRGGATTGELLALVGDIQSTVRERFGVELHPEPNFIGFDTKR